MAELWTDVVDPADLTGYARQSLEDYEASKGTLARFLPNRTVDDIVARFVRGASGLTEVAEYRSYDAETSIGDTAGAERVTLELPPLGRKFRNSEYDQLRSRGQVTDERVAPTIDKTTAQAARAVADRFELERGRVIDTAKVTINEGGFIQNADFGRRADFNATAATLWDADGAEPLDDLITWVEAYNAENGENPGTLLTSTKVRSVLLRSAAARSLFVTNGNTPARVTAADMNAYLVENDLPTIEVYDRRVKVGGVNARTTPENKLYLLPAATDPNNPDGTDLGGSFWGTTLEASEPAYSIPAGEQAGLVVGAYKTLDPIGVWVHAAAIGLPVLTNPNLSLAAAVLG